MSLIICNWDANWVADAEYGRLHLWMAVITFYSSRLKLRVSEVSVVATNGLTSSQALLSSSVAIVSVYTFAISRVTHFNASFQQIHVKRWEINVLLVISKTLHRVSSDSSINAELFRSAVAVITFTNKALDSMGPLVGCIRSCDLY